MEEIQEYLFENSDDISENHYITLMDLCFKIHNTFKTQAPFIPNIVNNVSNVRNMNRRVEIFEYDPLELANDLSYPENFFMMVKSKLNLEISANIIDTDLYFPASLSNLDRQAIHIFIKMDSSPGDICSSSSGYDRNRKISVYFSKEFLQLI